MTEKKHLRTHCSVTSPCSSCDRIRLPRQIQYEMSCYTVRRFFAATASVNEVIRYFWYDRFAEGGRVASESSKLLSAQLNCLMGFKLYKGAVAQRKDSVICEAKKKGWVFLMLQTFLSCCREQDVSIKCKLLLQLHNSCGRHQILAGSELYCNAMILHSSKIARCCLLAATRFIQLVWPVVPWLLRIKFEQQFRTKTELIWTILWIKF